MGTPSPSRILVVEDSRTQLDALVRLLEREGYRVSTASDGREAIRKALGDAPDLVVLDMVLPDMDGREVLRILKKARTDHFLPVIMLSVNSDTNSKVTGLRNGADDFVAKPFVDEEILARCAAMLRIKELQEKLRDAQRRLEEQSVTDALTGLKNRRFFDERLQEEFRRAQRYGDCLSLIIIDLDHFKQVNDRHGHPAGDLVLQAAAGLLRSSIRDPDICARYGGEEFAVILPKTHMAGALAVAERIWAEIGKHEFALPKAEDGRSQTIRITASFGIAFFPSKDVGSPEQLLCYADEALYRAKHTGRNTICLYQSRPYRYDASQE